ncbi:integrase catalytic domain-containing protein [Trichonephila clavipes]|uniref:Integrase catalytic domain-containing protein n=1 Tax=Trichonephila clavipes TaxID=2585209 RepID=A0A8X6S0V1_TRICX|nr:integrase catalytic domain-containing protein [Trichonephila clavipes]
MEVDGMLRIFNRSEKLHNLKYSNYIGDGDTKTINALSENKPYGDDYLIQKIECVGHVQKRMGTRLMKLKLVYSKKELSDGKTIGGKGRLTDSLIDKLAHYYGNAIRCNSTSVKEMRKAIWAVWGHSCSTDDEPIHWFCPTNPNTWCKYNAAINNNLQNYKHKPSVAKAVQDVIKPVFADLSHPALLKKCLGDVLSRGLLPEELRDDSLWWHGPELLQSTYSTTVIAEPTQRDDFDCELRVSERTLENSLLSSKNFDFFNHLMDLSHNYFKIIHIVSYIYRFIESCRSKGKKRGFLTTSEDDKGVLRVGGRLEKASIPYSQKHPAILAKNSKLNKIYFITLHKKLFHVSPQGLLNAVRLRFWALGGRNLARKTVHTCVVCFKCKPIPSSQIMGNLPYERVNMAPPFSITGLDLGVSYFVTYKHQRKGVLNKIYGCVCICFVTRAMHLEILSDLTSNAIIATLKRFMSRRGKCSKIFRDNATNFVGANSQLKAFYKTLNFSDQNLAAYFTEEGIEWNFISPRAPHMGGLWEAGIKSVKYHLKRALGRSRLTYEEFETVII